MVGLLHVDFRFGFTTTTLADTRGPPDSPDQPPVLPQTVPSGKPDLVACALLIRLGHGSSVFL